MRRPGAARGAATPGPGCRRASTSSSSSSPPSPRAPASGCPSSSRSCCSTGARSSPGARPAGGARFTIALPALPAEDRSRRRRHVMIKGQDRRHRRRGERGGGAGDAAARGRLRGVPRPRRARRASPSWRRPTPTSSSPTCACRGWTAWSCCTRIKEIRPETMVLLMTAYGTVKTAVRAMKLGAEDYLGKPIDVEELEVVLERALEKKRLLEETQVLRERVEKKYRFDNLVGESPEMLAAFKAVQQVAPSSASVLLLGRERHRQGAVRPGPPPEQPAPQQALHQGGLRRAARRPCWRASCSATRRARSRARSTPAPAASRPPTAARCSWTRSATSRPRCR